MRNQPQTTRTRLGLLVIVAGLLGSAWAGDGLGWFGTPAAASRPDNGAFERVAQIDARIGQAQAALHTAPGNPLLLTQVGELFLQKARETGDPANYVKAEQAFQQAWQRDDQQAQTAAGLGNLALARHQFHDALVWGERARSLSPLSAYPYGILGDAFVELGRYDEAFDAFQNMVNRRPELASYARVSYARELQGDLPAAKSIMRRAADAGGRGTEARAWALVQLGTLEFTTGDLAKADSLFRQAEFELPGYVLAAAGQARVAAAHGRYPEAIALLEPAARRMPLPELVIQLGDTYRAAGQTPLAERQYQLARAMTTLLAANGVSTDLELALFNIDHDVDVSASVEGLESLYAARPSVKVAEALAWGRYKLGEHEQAAQLMDLAMRLGTQDPATLYRAGTVYQAAGRQDLAVTAFRSSFALNPKFSLFYAQDLESAIGSLPGESR